MLITTISPKREKRARRIRVMCGIVLTAVGMVAFLGWAGGTFPY